MKLSPWAAAIGFLLAAFVSSLQATTYTWPAQMNFQGTLTTGSGTAVSSGTYTIVFNIYSTATGGISLWKETQAVTVNSGLFDVVLGSVTPLTNLNLSDYNTDLWVGVTVNTDSEMTPRQQLLPSAYAIDALQVPDGGVPAPLDLTTTASSSANYILNLSNGNSGAGALGLTVTASNGANIQATNAAGYGVWGQTANSDSAPAVGLRGSAGAGTGVLAQSSTGAGLSATTQSTSGGSAGYFQAEGGSGLNSAVHAVTYSQSGANYFSDTTNLPAYGFYHYDPSTSLGSSGNGGRYGVYAVENCSTCYGGYFTNTGAQLNSSPQDGSALSVNGRLQVVGGSGASAGTIVFPSGGTTQTYANNYIPNDGHCLIFLTAASPVSAVAWVSAIGSGNFTVNLSSAPSSNVTYQYWIVGQ